MLMPGVIEPPAMAGLGGGGGGGAIQGLGMGSPLKNVEKIRTNFPETWLWINKTTG